VEPAERPDLEPSTPRCLQCTESVDTGVDGVDATRCPKVFKYANVMLRHVHRDHGLSLLQAGAKMIEQYGEAVIGSLQLHMPAGVRLPCHLPGCDKQYSKVGQHLVNHIRKQHLELLDSLALAQPGVDPVGAVVAEALRKFKLPGEAAGWTPFAAPPPCPLPLCRSRP
jgi:uncharacterized C2H2 Zn-finger protein